MNQLWEGRLPRSAFVPLFPVRGNYFERDRLWIFLRLGKIFPHGSPGIPEIERMGNRQEVFDEELRRRKRRRGGYFQNQMPEVEEQGGRG